MTAPTASKATRRWSCGIHLLTATVGNGTTACLRALYGTSDYTPQALSTNRIGVFSMMDDSPNYADLAIFMRSSRPDIAEMSVDIIDISNATNDQNGHREDMVGLEAAIDAQMILGIAAPTKLTSYLVGAESNNYIDVLSMDEYQRKELTSNLYETNNTRACIFPTLLTTCDQ